MKKLTFCEKLGYGSASLGDAISYTLIGTYLIFFLTTVVGIEPAAAGTVAAIGAVWNAVLNPIMGYCSDRVRTRFGKRRPLIFLFSIPLAMMIFILFTAVDLPGSIKPVYYGVALMLFWTSYSGYFVPYLALGAEYTSDYEDRTVLRLFASFFNMIGAMFAMVLPSVTVEMLTGKGLTTEKAWSVMGGFLAVVSAISIIVTVKAAKKHDLPCKKDPDKQHERFDVLAIFREYVSVTKLKPIKPLIFASLFSLIAYTMIMSDMVYFLTYNQGLKASYISAALMLRAFMGIALIPIVGRCAALFDKKKTLIGFYTFGAAGMVALKIIGVHGALGVVVYIVFVAVCTCVYWNLMPSIFYDVCEYDSLYNGRDRRATIVSFQGLVEAIAAGCGAQILGVILQFAGFDGQLAQQSEQALVWIENATTWVPIIFLLLGAAAIYKYPIDKKVYEDITKQRPEEKTDKK